MRSAISKIKSLFWDCRYGLTNIVAYLPIIWRDRDWDYAFALRLWAKKFDRMAYSHEHYGNHIGHLKTAQQLRVCAALCRRIDSDEYQDVPMAAHDTKWGRFQITYAPTEGKCVSLYFTRPNARSAEEKELERQEFIGIVDRAGLN